jgi:hypothetical protein
MFSNYVWQKLQEHYEEIQIGEGGGGNVCVQNSTHKVNFLSDKWFLIFSLQNTDHPSWLNLTSLDSVGPIILASWWNHSACSSLTAPQLIDFYSGNILDLYSAGASLKYITFARVSAIMTDFPWFISVPLCQYRITLQAGQYSFISYPFQFIIPLSSYHWMLYSLGTGGIGTPPPPPPNNPQVNSPKGLPKFL